MKLSVIFIFIVSLEAATKIGNIIRKMPFPLAAAGLVHNREEIGLPVGTTNSPTTTTRPPPPSPPPMIECGAGMILDKIFHKAVHEKAAY